MEGTQLDVSQYRDQIFGNQTHTPAPAPSNPEPPTAQTTTPPAADQPPATPEPATTTPPPATPDYTSFLKEYGFENIDSFTQKLKTWQELEKNPPKAEPTFPNEESRRWAEYFTAGKEEELYSALHARQQVKGVDALGNEDRLKLYIRLQNPMYDQELIDARFQRDYGFDESKFKDEDGNITDHLAYRMAKIDAQQKMSSDIEKANQYFSQYKQKIELPIIQQSPNPSQDEDYKEYLNYRKMLEQEQQSTEKAEAAYSKLSEKDIPFKFSFNDEASKLNFEVDYTLDKEGFEKARANCLNWTEYLKNRYYSEDGSPQTQKFLRDNYIVDNFDKLVTEIQKQTVNATMKWFLERNKGGGQQQVMRNYNLQPDVANQNKQAIFGKVG